MPDPCILCVSWPERDRWALRLLIDSLPAAGPICDECLSAFFRRLVIRMEEATEHRPEAD
jgi:hypothetical protein